MIVPTCSLTECRKMQTWSSPLGYGALGRYTLDMVNKTWAICMFVCSSSVAAPSNTIEHDPWRREANPGVVLLGPSNGPIQPCELIEDWPVRLS